MRRAAAAGRRPRGSTRARRRVQPKTKLDAAPKSQGPLAAVPTRRRLAWRGERGLIANLLSLVSYWPLALILFELRRLLLGLLLQPACGYARLAHLDTASHRCLNFQNCRRRAALKHRSCQYCSQRRLVAAASVSHRKGAKTKCPARAHQSTPRATAAPSSTSARTTTGGRGPRSSIRRARSTRTSTW